MQRSGSEEVQRSGSVPEEVQQSGSVPEEVQQYGSALVEAEQVLLENFYKDWPSMRPGFKAVNEEVQHVIPDPKVNKQARRAAKRARKAVNVQEEEKVINLAPVLMEEAKVIVQEEEEVITPTPVLMEEAPVIIQEEEEVVTSAHVLVEEVVTHVPATPDLLNIPPVTQEVKYFTPVLTEE